MLGLGGPAPPALGCLGSDPDVPLCPAFPGPRTRTDLHPGPDLPHPGRPSGSSR